jgi:hypothetical protein
MPLPRPPHFTLWITAIAVAVGLALGPAGAAARASAAVPSADEPARGDLVSAKHLLGLSREATAKELEAARFDSGAVRHGVDTYRLIYRTVDPAGQATTASGLVVLPRNGERRLRPVSFTHGTEINRSDVPSVRIHGWAVAPAITYGSAGFAAVAPDYLGLGRGPGVHPWFDVPSETTASLDMLRAAREFAQRKHRALERRVLVTGFSQGASAALGLARALQAPGTPGFSLGAVAPISGAYDLRHAELPALLGGELHPIAGIGYTSYLLVAWNRLHQFYADPAEVFQAPYDAKVEQLFDGRHTGKQMFQALPPSVDQLLTPHGFEILLNPSGRLAEAMAVADSVCSDWTPKAPVRLYFASRDREAANANTDHCLASLRSNGASARKVDVGKVDHPSSNVLGAAATVRWFSQLEGR